MSDDFSIDDDEGEMLLMGGETLLGKALVLRAGTAIVGVRVDADAATGSEQAGDLDVLRVHKADKILHDDVDTILVEVSVITEAEEVELETLALDHAYIGNVHDANLSKVRLSGNRAQRRELRAVEPHPVVVALMLVSECLEHLRSIVHAVLRLCSESLETL